MDEAGQAALRELLRVQPIAALGTLHESRGGVEPFVSMVPLAWRPGTPARPLAHVSALAPHTRDLRRDPRASLMLVMPLRPDDDPQAQARLTIQARARFLERGQADWAIAEQAYRDRFPRSAQTFALGDFALVVFEPESARWVGGFGRAWSLGADSLAQAIGDAASPPTAG